MGDERMAADAARCGGRGGRGSRRPGPVAAVVLAAAGLAACAAGPAAAQMDLGAARPEEPPASRYLADVIGAEAAAAVASLETARSAATGPELTAVDVALAVRRLVIELSAADRPEARAEDEDLVVAAQIAAEMAAWDRLARRAIAPSAPGEAAGDFAPPVAGEADAALRAFAEALDDVASGVPARARLAAAGRRLVERLGADDVLAWVDAEEASATEDSTGGGWGGRDGGGGAGGAGRAGGGVDEAAAALGAAVDAADWLGNDAEAFAPMRGGGFDPGLVRSVFAAADVIARISALEPRGRQRGRYRGAAADLAVLWPDGDDVAARRAFGRGWSRFGVILGLVERNRAAESYRAPGDLPIEIRRLVGLLKDRAMAAELGVLDRLDDLLLRPDAATDPDLVSLVAAVRTAVENVGRLSDRDRWLEVYAAMDPTLVPAATRWIDERLLRLGAPARRAEASRQLRDLDALVRRLDDPPGLRHLTGPGAGARSLLGGRNARAAGAFSAARRERLALAVGGDATVAAASIDRWLSLLRLLDVVVRVAETFDARGGTAAEIHPDWFVPGDLSVLPAEAARAVDLAFDRTFAEAGNPPADAIDFGRRPVGPAAAWLAAVPRTPPPAGVGSSDGLPVSLVAAIRSPRNRDLAAFSRHAAEASAAARAGDEAAADAHRALAGWIATTAFDPTRDEGRR